MNIMYYSDLLPIIMTLHIKIKKKTGGWKSCNQNINFKAQFKTKLKRIKWQIRICLAKAYLKIYSSKIQIKKIFFLENKWRLLAKFTTKKYLTKKSIFQLQSNRKTMTNFYFWIKIQAINKKVRF